MPQKAIKITLTLLLCIAANLFGCVSSQAVTPKQMYSQAEVCYKELRHSPHKMKYRHNWLRCIDKFQRVHRLDPSGPWAAAGFYKSAKLYQGLAKRSGKKSDYQEARDIFEHIVRQFPGSRYRSKAAAEVQLLDSEAKTTPTAKHVQPQKDNFHKGGMGTVDDLRFWSNPNYTRIVIDASRETSYYHHLLKKDPSINKPQRLYVDLKKSRLGKIKKRIPINDDLLMDARAGQYTHDSVRVVVDIKSFKTYKIFSLKDPFRIVIDVWGAVAEKKPTQQKPYVALKKNGRLPAGALAKQLALGISRIIIDPGHGGRDYGAPGYLKGVHEKDVVLQIARRLAKKIRIELKCQVFMTRNSDRFLTLEERTAIANTKNADLFISIHTNSHRNRRAFGIETYFLNLATDDEAIRVAAMENATSTKNISDLQNILYDLMQNAKINESSRLAGYVQGSMINHLKRQRYSRINDKGVKQAPFYVLLGAQMPAILVETSFISNPRECKRLINPKYQERLCEAIVLGIKQYIKETTPTAYLKPPPDSANNG
jgi:N-acetylmuramoyl-L-alanine amidase